MTYYFLCIDQRCLYGMFCSHTPSPPPRWTYCNWCRYSLTLETGDKSYYKSARAVGRFAQYRILQDQLHLQHDSYSARVFVQGCSHLSLRSPENFHPFLSCHTYTKYETTMNTLMLIGLLKMAHQTHNLSSK